jgi:hypothetical protein
MTPSPILDSYWRFAAERQSIFFRRLTDQVGPWSLDPILSTYRFTNAYRASDRVSQFLIRDVQYGENRSQDPRDIFFRTLLFKIFNRIDTWQAIERALGPLEWQTVDLDAVDNILSEIFAKGRRIYSPAYIMPAPRLGHQRKHSNHLQLIRLMMEDRLPDRIRQAPSLRSVYDLLSRYPGIGPFLAFQYTIDLNYSRMLEFQESDFVVAGPGARDGIAKCFLDVADHSPEEVILAVTDDQDRAFAALHLKFQTLYGRRLQPIDCQNLFCEISKYARVAHPEARGISGRIRIKQTYRPCSDQVPTPFYPPRWRLRVDNPQGERPMAGAGRQTELFI